LSDQEQAELIELRARNAATPVGPTAKKLSRTYVRTHRATMIAQRDAVKRAAKSARTTLPVMAWRIGASGI